MMGYRVAALLAFGMMCGGAAGAQVPPAPDAVDRLLTRVEMLVQAGDRAQFASLLAPTIPSDDAEKFADDLLRPDVRRALVREVDRVPLEGAPPGDGYRVAVELFSETAGQ